MKIRIPQSDCHPQVRLTVTTPAGQYQVTTDSSHKAHEVDVAVCDEDQVEVLAEFIGRNGKPDPGACRILVKEKSNVQDGKTEPVEDALHVRLEAPASETGCEGVDHAETDEGDAEPREDEVDDG